MSQKALVGVPDVLLFVRWFVVSYYSVRSEIDSVFSNLFAEVT